VSPIVQAMIEITEPMVDPLYTVPNQTNILDQIAEIEEVVQYTDPVGNTFEAPVVEEAKPKLSLDDILIRIPNEEKKKAEEAEIAIAIERVERKELKETLKQEDQKGKLPTDIQSRLDAFNVKREVESSILTPEEIEEEYELKHTDDFQDINEQKAQVTAEDNFTFDLGSDNDDVKFDDDFL
jgi:hypothetical protein